MTNLSIIATVLLVTLHATHAQLAMYLINDFVNTLNGNKPMDEGLTAGIDLNMVENAIKQQSRLQQAQESTMFKKRMQSFGRIPVAQLDNTVQQKPVNEPAGIVSIPTLPDQALVDAPVVGSPSQTKNSGDGRRSAGANTEHSGSNLNNSNAYSGRARLHDDNCARDASLRVHNDNCSRDPNA